MLIAARFGHSLGEKIRPVNLPVQSQRDQLAKSPPGEGQEALLGVIGRRAQHQAGIDQHRPSGQGG